MKIKLRIILTFSVITFGLIVLFAYYVSFFTRDSLQTKFFLRLEENAQIVGQNVIKNDLYNNRIYYEVKRKYLRQLSEGNDYVLRIVRGSNKVRYRPDIPVSDEFYETVFNSGKATYLHKKVSYVALFFKDPQNKEGLLVLSDFMLSLSYRFR